MDPLDPQVLTLQDRTGSGREVIEHVQHQSLARDPSTRAEYRADPLSGSTAGLTDVSQPAKHCDRVSMVGRGHVDRGMLDAHSRWAVDPDNSRVEPGRAVCHHALDRPRCPGDVDGHVDGLRRVRPGERGLAGQCGRPVHEHRRPLPLRAAGRAGVIDVNAAVHRHEFSLPQHPRDLVGQRAELDQLPARHDTLLSVQELCEGPRVESRRRRLGHAGRLPRSAPEPPPIGSLWISLGVGFGSAGGTNPTPARGHPVRARTQRTTSNPSCALAADLDHSARSKSG